MRVKGKMCNKSDGNTCDVVTIKSNVISNILGIANIDTTVSDVRFPRYLGK